MTWVRTTDTAPLHLKFFRAGVAAYGWWHSGLSYCNAHLTDGFIATRDLELVFPGTSRDLVLQLVDALVRERSLHVVMAGQRVVCHAKSPLCPRLTPGEDGCVIHDYFEFQPTRRDVIKDRRHKAVAGRKGGETTAKRWQQGAMAHAEADSKHLARPPSRPVPSRPELLKSRRSAASPPAHTPDGTPPPDDGRPSSAMQEVLAVLERCPAFRASAKLRDEAFWRTQIEANPGVDVLAQTLKAQAWLTSHPRQAKRDLPRFLHNWFANPLAREP